MQKRIAIISYHSCPLSAYEGKETGGMNTYVLSLAKELSQRGFLIDIFTRNQDEKKEKIVVLSPTLRVVHLDAGPKENIAKKHLIAYIDEFVASFKAFVKQEKINYEILDCHYYLSGLIGLKIKKELFPIPIVMTFHTLSLMKNLVARTEAEMENASRIEAEFMLAASSDMIISPTQNEGEYLEYLYNCPKEKITIIPPGIDTSLFKPIDKIEAKKTVGADKNHKLILFVGRIEPLKGIDTLLYAMKILAQRKKECTFCLWIVGGEISQVPTLASAEISYLESLKNLLGLSNIVQFIGRKLPEELPYFYNAADVVVMPSHYESFGIAVLEAMACGTPVITTNVSGVSTLIDDKHLKLVASASNPLQLASQMELLLVNDTVSRQFGRDIAKKVQDLTWSHVTEKVIRAYKKLLS
ncbi:MAG: glycosyltransferase [Candidatus Levyibacteriota bacterium]